MRQHYEAIDIKRERADAWPEVIPPLTPEEAERAARRLWRFALGETFIGRVHIGTGNRINWYRDGTLTLNPSKGWREMVHDLSHLFVYRANPGERPHSKFHARFEAKLVREVVRRGWLEGKLRTPGKPPPAPQDKRQHKLDLILAGIDRWERKRNRAERALAKLNKQRRYYEKALGLS